MRRLYAVFALLMLSAVVQGATELFPFSNAEQEQRFKHLLAELRCLVCQNQSLADSNAELAQDLRRELYEMMQRNVSDQEIIAFMVDRYGEFVLYRPPVKSTTYMLWFAPLALVLTGMLAIVYLVRRRQSEREPLLSEADRARARRLLNQGKDHP